MRQKVNRIKPNSILISQRQVPWPRGGRHLLFNGTQHGRRDVISKPIAMSETDDSGVLPFKSRHSRFSV